MKLSLKTLKNASAMDMMRCVGSRPGGAMKKWLAVAVLAGVGVLGLVVEPAAQVKQGGPVNAADTAWILTATALVLLMTPGLSFFYGGMVRLKNVLSTLMQSFMAMAVISLLWVVVGFSLSFGNSIH